MKKSIRRGVFQMFKNIFCHYERSDSAVLAQRVR